MYNQKFSSITAKESADIPKLLIAAGLFPETGMKSPGGIWVRTHDERLPFRGSSFYYASNGGPAALYLDAPRSYSSGDISFRAAFCEKLATVD